MAPKQHETKSHGTGRRTFLKTATGIGVTGFLGGCLGGGGGTETVVKTVTVEGETVVKTKVVEKSPTPKDLQVVKFTDSWVPEGDIAPVIHALDKGWFADEGIAMQYTRGFGSSDTGKEVGNKKTDIGFAGLTATASLVQQGMDLVWVAPLIPRPMSSIHIHPDIAGDVNSLKDLEGLHGAHAPGDVAWTIAKAAFDKENVNVDSMDFEVSWSFMSMLKEGKVDFSVGWSINSIPLWYADNPMTPKIMRLDQIIPAYGNGFLVHRDYLNENRQTIKDFLSVVYKSYMWTYQKQMSAVKTSVDTLLNYFEEMALGEGSKKTHLGILQMMLSVFLTDSVKSVGLGHPDEEIINTTFDVVNNYIVDEPVQPEDVVLMDDPLIEEGSYIPPNFESQSEWLKEIQPGGIDNPYF